jgi:beta-lactamase regulating signal transducer with metallopeptidase domain
MMTALSLPAAAQISAERLLNSVAAGLVIALFAEVLLRLIGRRNSGTRFAVWCAALLAIAASPFVAFSSPPATSLTHPVTAALTIPLAWAFYLFGAWAVIAVIGLLRVAHGMWHLGKVRRHCVRVDDETLDPLLLSRLMEFRASRPVELCLSHELRVPTAIGFFQPTVALPSWTLRELSTSELHSILLHELAHLRRWDDWTNLAQKVLRAVFFFHPAVWWVERRMSLEREMACDDIVLAHTGNPRAYAECLVLLAEKSLLRRGVAFAQAAVGRMRQMSRRILEILDRRRSHVTAVWKPAPWVLGGFSLACLVWSAHAPRLVAFGNARPAAVMQARPFTVPALAQEISSGIGVPVVRASFVERSGAVRLKKSSLRRRQRQSSPVPPEAGIPIPPLPPAPKVVKATAPLAPATVGLQQAIFVVMQGEQLGGAGPVFWHVSIWRFTLVPGNAAPVLENPAKSI